MNRPQTVDCADWVEVTIEEKDTIKKEQAKATPSRKIFTMKDDGSNAPSSFAEPNRHQVCENAKDSVLFLKAISFPKG